jgi:hypothetical protein
LSKATDQSRRRKALIESMTARLRPLCSEWPEDVFAEMVRHLADITIKYEGNALIEGYDRRTSDRLLSDMREMLQKSEDTRNEGGNES